MLQSLRNNEHLSQTCIKIGALIEHLTVIADEKIRRITSAQHESADLCHHGQAPTEVILNQINKRR